MRKEPVPGEAEAVARLRRYVLAAVRRRLECRPGRDRDDLESDALLGLLEAVRAHGAGVDAALAAEVAVRRCIDGIRSRSGRSDRQRRRRKAARMSCAVRDEVDARLLREWEAARRHERQAEGAGPRVAAVLPSMWPAARAVAAEVLAGAPGLAEAARRAGCGVSAWAQWRARWRRDP